MTEEELALLNRAVEAAQRAIADAETLRNENHRLRLALALRDYKQPRKRAGRPKTRGNDGDQSLLASFEALKQHFQTLRGRQLSDDEALILVLKQGRGDTYRAHTAEARKERKTTRNRLSAARTAKKKSR
ncbi:hypothetical protein [Paraburkholderia mimosarum]|uniref:hypothetical protein n=1 Tax=Paraburkholderia mimosarum TaxID=312026 RepID=UPI0012B5AF99|nr:hypothetical protein [Paraburkholderia mimosarum]